MLDLVAHPTEPGEFFGRGQGTFISHPTGSISAFSWAESLSVSTGSPELQIHVFLEIWFGCFPPAREFPTSSWFCTSSLHPLIA